MSIKVRIMSAVIKKRINEASLLGAFQIQLNVIYALLMREILTRYGRHNIGFMWLFVEPMLFTLGVTALFSTWRGDGIEARGISIVAFALVGYSSVLLWRNAANRCIQAILPNLTLLYHQRVRIIDIFFSRLLLEIAGATIAFVILSIAFMSIGWMDSPDDLLLMVAGWGLLIWFAVGLGFTIGALAEFSEVFGRIWHTMTYLMFPLSGAMFMLEWMPPHVREILLYIPMIHGVEMMRYGYHGDVIVAYYSPAYLAITNLVLLFIGLTLLQLIKKRIIP